MYFNFLLLTIIESDRNEPELTITFVADFNNYNFSVVTGTGSFWKMEDDIQN